MRLYIKRIAKTVCGLFFCAFGIYASIQANIGLSPWSALAMGISIKCGISYGVTEVMLSLVVLLAACLFKEKIGAGTLLDAALVGMFVNFFNHTGIIPQQNNMVYGMLVLLMGLSCIAVGTYFYIRTGLGCGPRDALMVALGKRFARVPIGLVRAGLEGCVLLAGWLLGGKVGIGTVVSVVGTGLLLQMTFSLFRFDAKGVRHENLLATMRTMTGLLKKYPGKQPEKAANGEKAALAHAADTIKKQMDMEKP
jgi:uncharacterized membrane protein YczE